jgi:hypothetical protein
MKRIEPIRIEAIRTLPCDACQDRCKNDSLQVFSDGKVWDMGTGEYTLSLEEQPFDTKGRRLMLCWGCAEALKPLLARGIVFNRRLLSRAWRDWLDERSTEWATTDLDYALHQFYEAECRRQLTIVGDAKSNLERRRYLRARRKSIARANEKLGEAVEEILRDRESKQRSELRAILERSQDEAVAEVKRMLGPNARGFGRDTYLQRVALPTFDAVGLKHLLQPIADAAAIF